MYQSFYGFREMPFNITPDPRFLYLSPTHLDALQHLKYGVREIKFQAAPIFSQPPQTKPVF